MILEVVLPLLIGEKVSGIEKVINGEVHSRETIVERHKGLVYKECHKLKGVAKQAGLEFDDIASIGFIGLIKTFDNFDPETYDVQFATYAVPMIWGEIRRSLRDSGTGVHYSRSIKELGWRIRKNEMEDFSVERIAKELQVDQSKVIHALDFLMYRNPGSLDQPIGDDEGATIANLFGDSDDLSTVMVTEFLNCLSESERIVAEGLMRGISQKVIGVSLNVSQVQVSRIRKRIAEKYIDYSNGLKIDIASANREEEKQEVNSKNIVEITEDAVNELRAKGMTYAAIAKHFGISAPTLATRRQNWELEKVRAQRQENKALDKSSNDNRVTGKPVEKISAAPTTPTIHETEIKELKEAIIHKNVIIREQQKTIDQLKAERDELVEKSADRSETSGGWKEEIKNERKLLAILLERETVRIKRLVEVG